MSLSLIHRFQNAHTGVRRSAVIGVSVSVLSSGVFVYLFLKSNRTAWIETGTAVGGLMSIIAVTLGAIALLNTIDSNSIMTERADRIFESKLQLEESLHLIKSTVEIRNLYPKSPSHLVIIALETLKDAGDLAIKNGMYRLLLSKDDPNEYNIDSSPSLQFLTLMQLVAMTHDDPANNELLSRVIDLGQRLRSGLSTITYTDIRHSSHIAIEHASS